MRAADDLFPGEYAADKSFAHSRIDMVAEDGQLLGHRVDALEVAVRDLRAMVDRLVDRLAEHQHEASEETEATP